MITMLDVVLKNNKKHVCVKYFNSDVFDRVLILKAHKLVTDGLARYASKSDYKAYTRATPKAEPVVVEVPVEQEHVKLKAKERRAKNKKNT